MTIFYGFILGALTTFFLLALLDSEQRDRYNKLRDERDALRVQAAVSDDVIAYYFGDRAEAIARMGTYSAGADVEASAIVDELLMRQGRADV